MESVYKENKPVKSAKLRITTEALSDVLRIRGLDIWITGGKMVDDQPGVMEFTVVGAGLPEECKENSNKSIMISLSSDALEFDGTEIGAKITHANNIDLSKGYLVIPRKNALLYGVVDNAYSV